MNEPFDLDWAIVFLDFCLMMAWAWLGVTYIGNGRRWRGTCFILAAFSLVTLTIGDIGTALGFTGREAWYFDRWVRGIPWRFTSVAAFCVQGILIRIKSF